MIHPRPIVAERTTVLPAPPGRVFDAVNSPTTAPVIDPSVTSWTPDTDPIGVGTRFDIRGHLGRLPIRGRSVVTAWDPPSRSEFRSLSPSRPFRMVAIHRFESDGSDRTRYTWRIEFVPTLPGGRLVARLAARIFDCALEAQGDRLTAYFDRRS